MVKIVLLLIILAVIASVIWLLRSNRRRRPRTRIRPMERPIRSGPAGQLETLRLNRTYWGVEIQSGMCEASRALAGRQFPFSEAPAMPLADCAASSCTCIYLGLWERRRWHRRTLPDRRRVIRYLPNHPDRRCHRERRKIDVLRNRKW
jgi:hypothetical protein